jgi:hypothetical protein
MSTYERNPLVGRRIRLVYTDDPYTRLTPGAEGTVTFVDDLGTVAAKWDDGSTLGLVAGHDRYDLLPEMQCKGPRCERGIVEYHESGMCDSCLTDARYEEVSR